MPPPLAAFFAVPSVKVTLVAILLWAAYDVGCSYGTRGCPGGSFSRAVAGLYHAYSGIAEYAFLSLWIAVGLFLSWHFRTYHGR